MSKILGIFTCYNRKEKTLKCLDSLILGNPSVDFSFIAVDDNSSDGTKEALLAYKNIRVISGNGQCYYSGGMRLGIHAAKESCDAYDWILLFNDDVTFFPRAIEKLEDYAVSRDEILAGAACDNEGNLSYGGVLKKSRFKPAFEIIMSQERRRICDSFNANCVLLPTAVFKVLPNIDRHYVHSMGDYDYGLEASKMNIPIAVSDFFVGVCADNPLEGTWRDVTLPRKERLKKKENPKGLPWRPWFYFVRKHYGLVSACASSITPYIKILLRKS